MRLSGWTTLNTKFWLTLAPAVSKTVTLIVLAPVTPAAGVIVSARCAPVPVTTTLPGGSNAPFDALTVSVKPGAWSVKCI